MSYYDNQQWSAAAGQASWEQQTPPARSGASSAVPREDPTSTAFSYQMEEVDRALENLYKSGKIFTMPVRRDSVPLGGAGRQFNDMDPRMGASGPPRHHSVSEFGDARSYSASNLQNFYATQRHQPSRPSEAEQVMQAKRRMAAQRERELRNYHQEQQYNRSVSAEISSFGGKPDRTASPGSGMSDQDRRDLIASQRRALYGEGPFPEGFPDESGASRPTNQGSAPISAGPARHSPLTFGEHYNRDGGADNNNSADQPQAQGQQQRSRANSTSSPSSNPNNFALFENAQQSSRTSNSSPGGSPPRQGKPAAGSVAPIGTRPAQAANPALNKRSTTPLPSPLSYGFAAGDEKSGNVATASSAAPSNTTTPATESGLGWGNKSGVWGKGSLTAQASVWG